MKEIECPVCGKPLNAPSLRCKDHSVSGEMFDIYRCPDCGFAVTVPQPSPSEIGKYYRTIDYVSHSETRKGIVNKLYHLVRKRTAGEKLKLINRLSSHRGDLLDVGCGTGYFLSVCKGDGWRVEGVEVDDGARSRAEARSRQPVYASTDDLAASGKQFDVVTLWHVFEHLHDIHSSFVQLKRLLKPGGWLILAMPNFTSGDAAYYGECWAAYDVPRHLSHFSPAAIRLLAGRYGMKTAGMVPMKFDAYYVSMLSEGWRGRGKTGALLHGLIQGYRSNRKGRKMPERYSSLIYLLCPEKEP